MTCGIYLLKFNNTDKVYVGQSLNIENRYKDHLYYMKKGISSIKLNEAYKLYGVPVLEIICEVNKEELDENENLAIEIYDSVHNGFNCKDSSGYRMELRGENAPAASISNEQVRNIFEMLLKYTFTQEEIATKLNVSRNIVKDISCGNSHYWLEEEYGEVYTRFIEAKGTRSRGELNATAVYSNEEIEKLFLYLVTNNKESLILVAKKFNNIKYETIKAVASCTNHIWLKIKYPEEYKILLSSKNNRMRSNGKEYPHIISPEGVEYNVTNIRKFALEHGLNQGHLGNMLRGNAVQHKGWKLK